MHVCVIACLYCIGRNAPSTVDSARIYQVRMHMSSTLTFKLFLLCHFYLITSSDFCIKSFLLFCMGVGSCFLCLHCSSPGFHAHIPAFSTPLNSCSPFCLVNHAVRFGPQAVTPLLKRNPFMPRFLPCVVLVYSVTSSWVSVHTHSCARTHMHTHTHTQALLMVGQWMEDTEYDSQDILKQYKVSLFLSSGCQCMTLYL